MSFCILGENCSVFDRHTDTAGIAHRNPLCEGCYNRSRRELNLLRYDFVDLSQMVPRKGIRGEANIFRPKPESSPPADLTVLTLRDQIFEVVHTAEVALRLHMGLPVRSGRVRDGFGLNASVEFLHPRVDDLARLPTHAGNWDEGVCELDGCGVLLLFTTLHRRSRRLCGLDARTLRVPGLCPSCGMPALRRHNDDAERFWCAYCQLTMSRDEFFAAQRMVYAAVTAASQHR